MGLTDYFDSALVLFGHGSTEDPDAADPVRQHVATLRNSGHFAAVREAFWKQAPLLRDVLATLNLPRVFLVPLFISEGHFAMSVIPRALGFSAPDDSPFPRRQQRGEQLLLYCRPVGTHPGMTSVVLARAVEVVTQAPFPRTPLPAETTLIIAGHGTAQNQNSRAAIEQQVDAVRARRIYAAVHAVYLEEEPRIGDCYRLAPTRNLIVVPFLIGEGPHTKQDIPVLLGEPERLVRQRLAAGQAPCRNPTERHGKRLWYAASVGTAPQLPEIILDRVREASV